MIGQARVSKNPPIIINHMRGGYGVQQEKGKRKEIEKKTMKIKTMYCMMPEGANDWSQRAFISRYEYPCSYTRKTALYNHSNTVYMINETQNNRKEM